MQLMKYIWRNAKRNKLRSILTILSVGICLAMMTVLYGYQAMQAVWGGEADKHNRIVAMNIQGFSGQVPIAYLDRIRGVPGVKAAVPYSWFGGVYKDERMPFAQFATDPKFVFQIWDELDIDPDELRAWQEDRLACVADSRMVARRNWKIGERIPLQGTFYPVNLDLVLVGSFDSPQYTDSLWFHFDYLDESLRASGEGYSGNAGMVYVKVEPDAVAAEVCKAIDDRFANSENATRTQTEAAFGEMFADMMGNIRFFILIISLAVVFSLSLVAANAMAMSTRERTTEIAVLKAIGFSRGRVLSMILGEACFIALLGGILGAVLGCACLELLHGALPQFFPFPMREMAGPWILYGVLIAAGIGAASGIVPAIHAAQLSVVNGLRRVV